MESEFFFAKNGRFEPPQFFFGGGGTDFHRDTAINEQHCKDVFW